MAPKRKYLLVGLVVAIAAVAIYSYKEYNRKPADLTTVTAQDTVTVDKLIAAYEADEQNANMQYLGKTILVSGTIAEINNQQDTLVNLLLGKDADMHKVSCVMHASQLQKIKQFSVGKPITIKGICTGFLADVELNRCVIVNDK